MHTILTDNGSEFTDRFAVDMKNKPKDKPSGNHPFDKLCAKRGILHRLIRPYRPQTNGMVERFNRRIGEAIALEPKRGSAKRTFTSHADRDAFLYRFVADYNRTRLRCLGYKSPTQVLANLTEHNTKAREETERSAGTGLQDPAQRCAATRSSPRSNSPPRSRSSIRLTSRCLMPRSGSSFGPCWSGVRSQCRRDWRMAGSTTPAADDDLPDAA